jgi:hypothetical protein
MREEGAGASLGGPSSSASARRIIPLSRKAAGTASSTHTTTAAHTQATVASSSACNPLTTSTAQTGGARGPPECGASVTVASVTDRSTPLSSGERDGQTAARVHVLGVASCPIGEPAVHRRDPLAPLPLGR